MYPAFYNDKFPKNVIFLKKKYFFFLPIDPDFLNLDVTNERYYIEKR